MAARSCVRCALSSAIEGRDDFTSPGRSGFSLWVDRDDMACTVRIERALHIPRVARSPGLRFLGEWSRPIRTCEIQHANRLIRAEFQVEQRGTSGKLKLTESAIRIATSGRGHLVEVRPNEVGGPTRLSDIRDAQAVNDIPNAAPKSGALGAVVAAAAPTSCNPTHRALALAANTVLNPSGKPLSHAGFTKLIGAHAYFPTVDRAPDNHQSAVISLPCHCEEAGERAGAQVRALLPHQVEHLGLKELPLEIGGQRVL